MPDISQLPFWSTKRFDRLYQIVMIVLRQNGGSFRLKIEDLYKATADNRAILHQLDPRTNDLIVRLVTKEDADRAKAAAVAAIKNRREREG